LSLQKSLVELHVGFLSEIGATSFAHPVPPGFPEGTFNRLVQASILCPFSWQPKHLLWARLLCLFYLFGLSSSLNEHMDA
jgi:hypothetical protein